MVAGVDSVADLMAVVSEATEVSVKEEDLTVEGSEAMEVLVVMEEDHMEVSVVMEVDLMEVLVAMEGLVADPKHQPADIGAKHLRAKTTAVRITLNPPRTQLLPWCKNLGSALKFGLSAPSGLVLWGPRPAHPMEVVLATIDVVLIDV